jgi:hypothetical protein
MKQAKLKKRLLDAALSGAIIVAAGLADAGTSLTIMPTVPGSNLEAAGQASGMQYPYPGGFGPGAGLPTTATTPNPWPVGPGFAQEPGFGQGISGYDASYLQLNKPGPVTFQFMGAGDSGLANSFWLFYDDGDGTGARWHQLFQDGQGASPTGPCPVQPNGAATPSCDKVAPGIAPDALLTFNQYTIPLSAGFIPFAFDLGGDSATANNGPFAGPIDIPGSDWTMTGLPGSSNYASATGNPADTSGFPGFFLGIDPYLATGQFQLTGNVAYAGLADLPRTDANGRVMDHDYQDMAVRISAAPEPGSLLLIGAGAMALAMLRRKA